MLKYFSNGQQKINSEIYDVSENSDFEGVSVWGNIRVNLKFILNKSFKIGVGYSISDNKTLNENKEKIQISSNGIRINLTYIINKN